MRRRPDIDVLSADEARRLALRAQRLDQRPSEGGKRSESIGRRNVAAHVRSAGVIQIDSVNVFARAHYMPFFSRLGPYRTEAFDALAAGPHPRVIEAWAHEAAFVPVETWPLLAFRRAAHRDAPGQRSDWARENDAFIRELAALVRASGRRGITVDEIEHERGERRGAWWGWSDVKRGLEWLFRIGEVCSGPRRGFRRVYVSADLRLPSALLNADVPESDAIRELTRVAARNLGVATTADLADYYRISRAQVLPAVHDLLDDGTLRRVEIPGWGADAVRDARLAIPRRADADALVSPFDPIVWCRPRALRLFGFDYRIEIYTPAAKRQYGYYCLPYLLGDRPVARVDLKADRQRGALVVRAAWSEPGAPQITVPRLASQLDQARSWCGLDRIEVEDRGDLADALRNRVHAAASARPDCHAS